MAGAIAITIVLLVLPSLILIGGGIMAALLGTALQSDGERRLDGSELLALDD